MDKLIAYSTVLSVMKENDENIPELPFELEKIVPLYNGYYPTTEKDILHQFS